MFSCKKDHSVLGVDEQPAGDQVNAQYLSGMPVTGFSLPYDSIACYNDAYKFLGSNNDPYFGRVDYGLYLNANTSRTDNDFTANSRISSAEMVFALVNTDYAGDANAVLNYSIFPINTGTLSTSDVYYTNDNRRHSTTPICTGTVTTSTDSATGQPILRLKIDSTYAEKILHDTPNLVNNDIFQAAYPGYYIATSLQTGSEGVIYEANLEDPLSGFYLHYRTGPTASDTLTDFKFDFSGSAAVRYNTVKFTPKQALKDQFADSTLGASNLYVKGMGISRLKLQIPFLKNYSDTFKIAVNRAEVILQLDPTVAVTSYNYPYPPKLILLAIDSLSREIYIRDELNSTDFSRYDGTYDGTNNRYVFNIAREAQQIFEGSKKNRGFYLVVADLNVSLSAVYSGSSKELSLLRRDNYFQGVVFGGSANPLKPTFNLSYVRFNKD